MTNIIQRFFEKSGWQVFLAGMFFAGIIMAVWEMSSGRSAQESAFYDKCLIKTEGKKDFCGAMLREAQRTRDEIVNSSLASHRNSKTGKYSYYTGEKWVDADGKEVDPGFSDVPPAPPGFTKGVPVPEKN